MPTTPAPPPLLDVSHVAEETSAREVNKMLREGWLLLLVVAAHDGAGGYPVYVLGKCLPGMGNNSAVLHQPIHNDR